jgi:transcriptional regulator with XRE-family HTH domain
MGRDDVLARLGRLVKARRITLDLSQKDASGRARVSHQTWLNVERGRGASDRSLAKIERALDWPIGTIEAINAGDGPSNDEDFVTQLAAEDLTADEIDQVWLFIRRLRRQRSHEAS